MKSRYTLVAGLAVIAALALVSSAIGGPSLKSLVKNEVAKQLDASGAASAKAKGKRGPRGPAGPQGPAGAAGAAGLNGTARAYARVTAHSITPCATQCAFDDAKGITSVTHPSLGHYCVTAPGIDGSQVSPAVSVDWAGTANPEGNGVAMPRPAACGGTAFEVVTERLPTTGTIEAAESDGVGFTIVIP